MIIIDRFEENFAVCDIDGIMQNISRSLIEENAKEGDVLIKTNEEKYTVDKSATDALRDEIINMQNSLWE